MHISRLDDAARDAALQQLPQWTYDADAKGIRRNLRFTDFAEAFGFNLPPQSMQSRLSLHHVPKPAQ